MMGEFGSEDKKVSKQLQIQKSALKRSNSALTECDTGEDGRMVKMKKSNPETIQQFVKPKPVKDCDDVKQHPKRQHEVDSDKRLRAAKCNDGPVSYKVAHRDFRRSTEMLKLLPSPSSSLEDDVVRDGPKKIPKVQLLPGSDGQFAHRSRVMQFPQHSSTTHSRVVGQNWEGSDNDELCRASEQMCVVAKPERGNTPRLPNAHHSHHSDELDNSNECFRSPAPSRSGSPKTPQCSEQFAVEGSIRETDSGSYFSNTIRHSTTGYYSTEGAEQHRIIRSSATVVLVTGTHSAAVLRRDPSSSSSVTSADLQSDTAVYSQDEQISSGCTAMHSGDGIEITIPPNLRQSQQPSSSSSPQVSRKVSDSDDESFYSAQSHVSTTSTSLDPANKTVTYEERLSEGSNNLQHVPDVL